MDVISDNNLKNDFENIDDGYDDDDDDDLVNGLPDDCLGEIFRRLPIYQRIEIEKVCRRWKMAAKNSWHDLKSLPFTRFSSKIMDSKTIREIQKNPKLMKKILKRCAIFLRELKIATSCDPQILTEDISDCVNLQKLTIDGDNMKCRTTHSKDNCDFNKIDLNLQRFSKLTYLSLRGLPNCNNILKSVINNGQCLTHLSLSRCNLSQENLELIHKFNNLEALQLTRAEIDDNWLRKLIRSCAKIRHLDISYSESITDVSATDLTSLPSLESLSIQSTKKITETSIKDLHNLKELNCSHCPHISDNAIINLLKHANNLIFLNLYQTQITTRSLDEAYTKWLTMAPAARANFKMAVSTKVKWSWKVLGKSNKDEPFQALDREGAHLENISIFR